MKLRMRKIAIKNFNIPCSGDHYENKMRQSEKQKVMEMGLLSRLL